MEDNWARQSLDRRDADRSTGTIGDAADRYADDPLGDEAAFPSTWQHVASGEGRGRD
jgi:hypothetical protein